MERFSQELPPSAPEIPSEDHNPEKMTREEKGNTKLTKEQIIEISNLLDAEHELKIAQEEIQHLESHIHELNPQEYAVRLESAEIAVTEAQGDILLYKKGISDEVIEVFKEEDTNKSLGKIPGYNSEEQEIERTTDRLIHNANLLGEKAKSYGHTLDAINEFQDSADVNKKRMYQEITAIAESLQLEKDFQYLITKDSNRLLDAIKQIPISDLQMEIFKQCSKSKEISRKKLIDTVFSSTFVAEDRSEAVEYLEEKITKDKDEARIQLPVEEMLSSWEKNPPTSCGWSSIDDISLKIATRIEELSKEGNTEGIIAIKNKLYTFTHIRHSSFVPKFYKCYPMWIKNSDLTHVDAEKLLINQLPEESFREYFGNSTKFVPFHLIPESFSKEEKEAYYGRLFFKDQISTSEIVEYSKLVNKDFFQIIEENKRALIAFLINPEIRKTITTELLNSYETKVDSNDIEKYNKTKNIIESFKISDNEQELDPVVIEVLHTFEKHHGNKGRDIVALAVAIYGIENAQSFKNKMESIEQILTKYNHEAIPSHAKVSMGIEYEITNSIANIYDETSLLGYKSDIVLLSESARIGKGRDGVHEIALKPNYNPYMLMAEMKLLQEGGFLDLNFDQYPNAPRGYHLSLVGDRGLYVNENMFFLNNIMTMAQLTGITAGKEITATKNIHSKSFENFSDTQQTGERCEIKGMGTDSVEQFEKAIITSHHAGIAIQLCDKYLGRETIQFMEVPSSPEAFEMMLTNTNSLLTPFETNQELEIVYQWTKLKKEISTAIGQHNSSFVDSEFNGFILDTEGNYTDTGEHIDIMRNKKLLDSATLNSEEFRKKIHLNINDMYQSQKSEFVNALTITNNVFLKPPPPSDESAINAKAVLDTVKQEGYGELLSGSSRDSIFEHEGQFRDGYYYVQGASEEMIIHKAQILLIHFNIEMNTLLKTKGVPRTEKYVIAA